jgi:ABC-type transport system substrate-binding protein
MVDSIMTSIHYVTYNMREDRDPGNVLFGPPQGSASDDDRMREVGRAVRRAMAYAVPKQQAIQVATGGTALELQAPISRALEFWYNEDVESFNLDLEAARSELEGVGFSWDDDGIIHYPADYPPQ